jgi:hypothetical protein
MPWCAENWARKDVRPLPAFDTRLARHLFRIDSDCIRAKKIRRVHRRIFFTLFLCHV